MRALVVFLAVAASAATAAEEAGQDAPYKTGISRQCPDGKWRRECEGWTSATVNAEGAHRQAPPPPPASQDPEFSGTSCTMEGQYSIARGIVTAGAAPLKLARVEVTFYSSDGTVMDVGTDFVTMPAHDRAPFEVYGPRAKAARCEYALRG